MNKTCQECGSRTHHDPGCARNVPNPGSDNISDDKVDE